ncbi:MAG: arginine--tRNA ligase [Candidatus Gracilibacteria bacterium]|nr:arginine--tRNA ligase [Candidatus Gracilibacteria bacterium]
MQNIQSFITNTIKSLYGVDFSLEISPAPKAELGEYCIGVFQLAKPVGKAPNMIAEELATELAKNTEFFVSTNSIGGYVNFFLTDSVWLLLFADLNQSGNKPTNQQTIVVDYIGANIGKPLHIGHLCTPSIGQAIINIYRYLGYKVIGDTHVGDWGLFGKLIAAHKLLGRANGLEEKGVEYLLELYIQITEKCEQDPNVEEYCRNEFKKLSEGDEENMRLWGEFTSTSLKAMNAILALIHVVPDYDIGESFYENLPLPKIGNQPALQYTMNDIIEELLEKKIATKNEDGSVAVIFPEETKLPSTVIQKKNGTNLYITADICAIKYRLTNGWNPAKIIYSVDLRQQLHFKQCFEICRMAGWIDGVELFHAGNGHISLPDGAMSTRKGNIIRLEDLVSEGFVRTKKILEEKGRNLSDDDIREITVGAIKYSYLMQDRERNIIFDWNKALSFEGNSGPYIQYAYVRAKKISETTSVRHPEQSEGSRNYPETLDSSAKPQNDGTRSNLSSFDKSLIQTLRRMETIVQETAEKYKPHILALYCYDLAVAFNSFYVHTPKILEESDENLKQFRLALCEQFVNQIRTGFELLGMKMPSEM